MPVVSLENFSPGARYDGNVWTRGAIEEGDTAEGPWTRLEVQDLVPLDTNAREPQSRDFTTALASSSTGWFRIVWIDGAGMEQPGGAAYSSIEPLQSRGETAQDLLRTAIDIAGFDIDRDTEGLELLNRRHRELVTSSRCLRRTVRLGVAIAGQDYYPADPDIVELYELTIGGQPYKKARRADITAGRSSRLVLEGYGGIFIPDADESGVAGVTISPTVEAGQELVAFAAMRPQDLELDDRPVSPPEFNQVLIEGVIALGLALDPEQLNAADRYENRWDVGVEKLRRQVRRQLRGSGPAQIRVQGMSA